MEILLVMSVVIFMLCTYENVGSSPLEQCQYSVMLEHLFSYWFKAACTMLVLCLYCSVLQCWFLCPGFGPDRNNHLLVPVTFSLFEILVFAFMT
jgi:hypothetical protein